MSCSQHRLSGPNWFRVAARAAGGVLLLLLGWGVWTLLAQPGTIAESGGADRFFRTLSDSAVTEVWGEGDETLLTGNARFSVPLPLPLEGRALSLLDERWSALSAGVGDGVEAVERIALWRDDATGERFRSLQWFALFGSGEASEAEALTEAVMAADYLIVSPVSAEVGWDELERVAEVDGWSLSRRHPGSYVARVTTPRLFTGGLGGLETARDDFLAALPEGYRGDWSYLLELAAVPNDPDYSQQWALGVLDAPAAWARTTGSDDVVVAVIDTGVDYNHPDLRPNMWTNPHEVADGTDTSGNGFVDDIRGWDFAGNTNNPRDVTGHGTGVAGVLGAVGNNSFGIAGVAWTVRMMPLAVGTSNIPAERIVEAIDYAVWQREAGGQNVVALNISLGGRMPDVERDEETPLFLAVRRARDAGILGVFAAGNNGLNNDALLAGRPNHFFPSDIDLDNVLSVAGTTFSDSLYSTSNYGPESVDIAAPGHTIRTPFPGGGFLNQTGTSFAAPHVAGAVALVHAFNPHLRYEDVRAAVIEGSTPKASLEGKLANPVRLSLSGVLNEAARWPRVHPTQAWSEMPFLRSIDPEPLPVAVETEDGTVESVTYLLDGTEFDAVSAEYAEWNVSWHPPGPGAYSWTVIATSAVGREVMAEMPAVKVLAPYPFWQASSFGVDYEEAAEGFDPQASGGGGWTLAERFVFGLGVGPVIQPAPPFTAPAGRVSALPPVDGESLRLRFWQSTDSLFAPLTVLASQAPESGGWEPMDAAQVETLEEHPGTGRVLRQISVPAPDLGTPQFFRLRFDIDP